MSQNAAPAPSGYAFPPALISTLRERLGAGQPSLDGVRDEALAELLTAVFFASLETLEGAYYPVRVVLAGRVSGDVILPEGDSQDGTPMLLYRWSTLRFEPARPFSVRELVRLGIVTRSERLYAKVEVSADGLQLAGIAREGINQDGDPYLKILAPHPGRLSVVRGEERILEYTHGRVSPSADDVILGAGVVRRALESCARNASLGEAAMFDYLDTIRDLVRVMAAHGHGGILIVSPEVRPEPPAGASYRTVDDDTIGQLLRHIEGSNDARRKVKATSGAQADPGAQLRWFLRSAFASESERLVMQLGGFTAMDGATLIDCALGLCGFGVVLPVAQDVEALEAEDSEAREVEPYELSTRGTRHRAAFTYADQHPGSVVFVASHDGPVSCALKSEGRASVVVWQVSGTGLV